MIFQFEGVEFEWDEEKYTVNLRKHGVKFEEAAEVFFDPLNVYDDASIDEEKREYVLGFSYALKILFVVYVERGIRMRIISARPATPLERIIYAKRK